ncbi:YciI family protein [Luteimonas marina]|uniref:YciI family protein n=1 Tax=Luteimonas marina TaxID=488485 RepID=A0A5C5U9K3_9GAMM|nr:YciI family protein [Luteimonas marina]TWT22528.1 YciI family protein [Luteimonas marina]
MQYLLLVYTDETLLEALPEGEYDRRMRHCLENADELKEAGTLLGFQQLEAASTAKSVRRRGGKVAVVDGPFAETKEMLAGFNLIEADSLEDAIRLAEQLPWAETGCIEVRPVRDVDAVRRRVGAPARAVAG